MASTVAGGIVVLLAVTNIMVFSQYGAEGVRMWWSAKLLNKNHAERRPR